MLNASPFFALSCECECESVGFYFFFFVGRDFFYSLDFIRFVESGCLFYSVSYSPNWRREATAYAPFIISPCFGHKHMDEKRNIDIACKAHRKTKMCTAKTTVSVSVYCFFPEYMHVNVDSVSPCGSCAAFHTFINNKFMNVKLNFNIERATYCIIYTNTTH